MGANQTLSITIMRFVFSCGAFSFFYYHLIDLFFRSGQFRKKQSSCRGGYSNTTNQIRIRPIRLALFDRYFFECWRVATRPEMCFSRRVGDVYPFPLGCVGVARNKFGCRLEASARAKSTLVSGQGGQRRLQGSLSLHVKRYTTELEISCV